MTSITDTAQDQHDAHHGPAKGLMRWVLTTNHKDIGTMYLWFSFAMFLTGGAMAMIIRAELFQPGLQIVEPAFFNQMTTMHGLIMVFGAVMPAFVGLANWMIPMMIGAPDMAMPRMNNWSFWILPFAALMLVSTLFMEGGGPNFGWTFYAPLSTALLTAINDVLHFCRPHAGDLFDYGGDQYYRHHFEPSRPWHDHDENATICLDLADYRVLVNCSYAGIGRRSHYDADGHSL